MKSEDNVSLYYIRHSVLYGYWLSNVITYAVMIDRGEGRLDGNSLRLSKEIMHRVICLPRGIPMVLGTNILSLYCFASSNTL